MSDTSQDESPALPRHYDVIVIGAGPTGLTTALALTTQGKRVHIIDRHVAPLDYSRAILVNSRTINLLKPLGVSELISQKGIAVKTMRIYRGDQPVLSGVINYGILPFSYNLPQLQTENCLQTRLAALGVTVDRPKTFVRFKQTDDQVEVTLKDEVSTSATEETLTCDYLVGADGFHSKVREQLNVGYPVRSLPTELLGVDVVLNLKEEPDIGLFMEEDGIVLCFRLGGNRYRLAATTTPALESFYATHTPDSESWRAHFMCYFAIADRYGEGRVWLAGDAAHVHSPVGGRGMNMGVADAIALADAIRTGNFEGYARARHPESATWVKRSYNLTRAILMSGKAGRRFRQALELFVRVAGKVSPERTINTLFYQISGLADYRPKS